MKTNLIRTAMMLLMVAFIGVQAGAQSTISKPNKPKPSKPSKPTTTTTTTTPTTRIPTTKKDAMDFVTITGIKIGNVTYDGDMLTYYGQPLYANEMKYAKPQLSYNCTKTANDITLYTKIYRPNGTMITNSSSPAGYTTSDETDFYSGTDKTVALPGWGSDDGNYYESVMSLAVFVQL